MEVIIVAVNGMPADPRPHFLHPFPLQFLYSIAPSSSSFALAFTLFPAVGQRAMCLLISLLSSPTEVGAMPSLPSL